MNSLADRTPFPHPCYPNASIVRLTKGKAVIVDDSDLPYVVRFSWSAFNSTGKNHQRDHWYARRGEGKNGKFRTPILHRELMSAKKGQQVDHINGNGLDCRRSNMRIATKAENCRNRKGWISRPNMYKGVAESKRSWNATLYISGKRIYSGSHLTPESAALAYDAMAREHFGEFAALNFPNKTETAVS